MRNTVKRYANKEKMKANQLEQKIRSGRRSYESLLSDSAKILLYPPNFTNQSAFAYFNHVNDIRFGILSELAKEKLAYSQLKHNAQLTNMLASYVANYASLAAEYPLAAAEESSVDVMNQKIRRLNQALNALNRKDSEPSIITTEFNTIRPAYNKSIKARDSNTSRLDIELRDVPQINTWLETGHELIAEMRRILPTPTKTPTKEESNVSFTYKILYFIAKGLATRLKEIADETARGRGGTVTAADQKHCSAATKRAALLFYEWTEYQFKIGTPGITSFKVDQSYRKLESVIRLGCVTLS
jgi:hypothetical protein